MEIDRHLDWDGCLNVRDLGGLPTCGRPASHTDGVVRPAGVSHLPAGVDTAARPTAAGLDTAAQPTAAGLDTAAQPTAAGLDTADLAAVRFRLVEDSDGGSRVLT
jgi:hypothetical protein